MSADEQAIRDLISTWVRATVEGDLNRIISMTAEDVVFLSASRAPMGLKEFAEAFKGGVTPTVDVSDIHASGDLAYACCQISVGELSGSTLTVYRKQANGEWVLLRDANMLTTRA